MIKLVKLGNDQLAVISFLVSFDALQLLIYGSFRIPDSYATERWKYFNLKTQKKFETAQTDGKCRFWLKLFSLFLTHIIIIQS